MNLLLENIKKIRDAKGYSQEYVAKKLGIATVNYGKIERGITHMTIERLRSICEILDVDIFKFLEKDSGLSIESIEPAKLLARQKYDEDIIKKLNSEIDSLKRQIDEKALLIDMLMKEKVQMKSRLTSHLNKTCFWGVKDIDEEIFKNEGELKVEKLVSIRNYIIHFYKTSRDYFIKIGWLEKADFEQDYFDHSRIYKDMPENEILK